MSSPAGLPHNPAAAQEPLPQTNEVDPQNAPAPSELHQTVARLLLLNSVEETFETPETPPATIREYEPLSHETQAKLAQIAKAGEQAKAKTAASKNNSEQNEVIAAGTAAMNRLVETNVGLALKAARAFSNREVPSEDLVQEALITLYKAILNWDSTETSLSAHYAGIIMHRLTHYVDLYTAQLHPLMQQHEPYGVHPPTATDANEGEYVSSDQTFAIMDTLTAAELAKLHHIQRTERAMRVPSDNSALMQLQDYESDEAIEALPALSASDDLVDTTTLETEVYRRLFANTLLTLAMGEDSTVTLRDIEVICWRYGLVDGIDYTQGEVAANPHIRRLPRSGDMEHKQPEKEAPITRVRVGQIEKHVLSLIRTHPLAATLRAYGYAEEPAAESTNDNPIV